MKKILLLSVILIACETEPADFSFVEKQEGYINVRGNVYDPPPTLKTPVPECSNQTPASIRYTFEKDGQDINLTSPIDFDGANFSTTQPMALPAGTYEVTDIILLSGTGTITHVVPGEEDPRFPFAEFVNISLPFEVIISTNQTTSVEIEALCYTTKSIGINGELGWDGTAEALSTAIIFTTTGTCANLIGIRFGFGGEIFVPISTDNAITIPLPRDTPFEVRAYSGQTPVDLIGPDGEIVEFFMDEITYSDEDIPDPFTEEGFPNPEYRDFLNANTVFIETVCEP